MIQQTENTVNKTQSFIYAEGDGIKDFQINNAVMKVKILEILPEIKKALGISGIFSSSSAFYHKGTDGMEGCQIDLLIDREDRVINLCEIKWAASEFIISKSYAEALRKKLGLFTYYSKTKKQVFLTFISTYGLLPNEHSTGIVDNNITLNDLFSGV